MPHPDSKPTPEGDGSGTSGASYADRLTGLQTAWWKKVLPVQAVYRHNVRRLPLGRTLDIGCGLGRNLKHLEGNGVGVDHNEDFVNYCVQAGLTAYTPDDFTVSPEAVEGAFDSIILAHVVEHLDESVADEIIERFLPFVRSGGYVHFITPQEVGYRSDPTHVRFVGYDEIRTLASRHDLVIDRTYSYPFPRRFGRIFTYNEFNVLTHKNR